LGSFSYMTASRSSSIKNYKTNELITRKINNS
jgi:hypothetical protein